MMARPSHHPHLSGNIAVADRRNKSAARWLWLGAAFWLATIVTALAWITDYSFTPGATLPAPADWPAESRIQRSEMKPTLILFAHPRCPCTRATLGELARLGANYQRRFTAQVWFMKPAGVAAEWEQTDLWRRAAAIPGVSVHADEAGQEAARFGAQTSGQAMLYDVTGRQLFHGGLTISRGHAGDNPGRTMLEKLLVDQSTVVTPTPSFGCPLFTAPATNEEVVCNR